MAVNKDTAVGSCAILVSIVGEWEQIGGKIEPR